MKSISLLTLALTALLVVACKAHEEHTATSTTTSTVTTATTETTHTHTDASAEPGSTLTPAPAPAGVEPVAGPKLTPVDQGPTDPTFVAYRDRLRAAVKSRDAKAVAALVDPKLRTSFGGVNGDIETVLARPGMWEELDAVLAHGGSFLGEGQSRSFWAPYVYSAWPEERDAFSHLGVIGENVPLRKTPDANGEMVAMLSYDIVERAAAPSAKEDAWRAVKTADGRNGFVESKSVMSPVGYRAGFMKVNGEWKMNALVAGD
jgi:hypothetical protein